MFGIGWTEMILIGAVAVMLFGANLPDVARKFGRSYRDFRKGLSNIQSEFDIKSHLDLDSPPAHNTYENKSKRSYADFDDRDEATAPKFEPPSSEPTVPSSSSDK